MAKPTSQLNVVSAENALILYSPKDGKVAISLGNIKRILSISKGLNKIDLGFGDRVLVKVKAKVCDASNCATVVVPIGSDRAEYDSFRKELSFNTYLGRLRLKLEPLKVLWYKDLEHKVESTALSDSGIVGVAPQTNKVLFYSLKGDLISEIYTVDDVDDISYNNGLFGAIDWQSNVYVIEEQTRKLISKFKVDEIVHKYNNSISIGKRGILVCGNACKFYSFKGKEMWEFEDVGTVFNSPVYSNGYFYIPSFDKKSVYIVNEMGKVINKIETGGKGVSAAVCNDLLAVTNLRTLKLYHVVNPKKPRRLWARNLGGFGGLLEDRGSEVSFSNKCKFLALADMRHRMLKIFNNRGYLIWTRKFDRKVVSVSWKRSLLVVGLDDQVMLFKVTNDMSKIRIHDEFAIRHIS